MREFNVTFAQAIDMGTNTAMRRFATVAQDEVAIKYNLKCILASKGDQTQNPSICNELTSTSVLHTFLRINDVYP